jgi:hypothetical protein
MGCAPLAQPEPHCATGAANLLRAVPYFPHPIRPSATPRVQAGSKPGPSPEAGEGEPADRTQPHEKHRELDLCEYRGRESGGPVTLPRTVVGFALRLQQAYTMALPPWRWRNRRMFERRYSVYIMASRRNDAGDACGERVRADRVGELAGGRNCRYPSRVRSAWQQSAGFLGRREKSRQFPAFRPAMEMRPEKAKDSRALRDNSLCRGAGNFFGTAGNSLSGGNRKKHRTQ